MIKVEVSEKLFEALLEEGGFGFICSLGGTSGNKPLTIVIATGKTLLCDAEGVSSLHNTLDRESEAYLDSLYRRCREGYKAA